MQHHASAGSQMHPLACKATHRLVNQHKSPLHYLFHTTQLNPKTIETIAAVHRHPRYKPSLLTRISPSKDLALNLVHKTHHTFKYKVYSNGSYIDGGVGMSTILFKHHRLMKVRRYYLGPQTKHTVYEAELMGIILALYLLIRLTAQITRKALIGLNNQAAIWSLTNQSTKPSHYLLDHIHSAAEKLHKINYKTQQILVRPNVL